MAPATAGAVVVGGGGKTMQGQPPRQSARTLERESGRTGGGPRWPATHHDAAKKGSHAPLSPPAVRRGARSPPVEPPRRPIPPPRPSDPSADRIRVPRMAWCHPTSGGASIKTDTQSHPCAPTRHSAGVFRCCWPRASHEPRPRPDCKGYAPPGGARANRLSLPPLEAGHQQREGTWPGLAKI